MAKVKGPLMSMEATGTYGKALVFSQRAGQSIVRKHVIPSNPHSDGQETARNRMRVLGAAQTWLTRTAQIETGQTLPDKQRLLAVCPSGKQWNTFLIEKGVGSGGGNYLTAESMWNGLTTDDQLAWEMAANALTPSMPMVDQTMTGGLSTASILAGQVFFILRYTLSVIGLVSTPGPTPPVYA